MTNILKKIFIIALSTVIVGGLFYLCFEKTYDGNTKGVPGIIGEKVEIVETAKENVDVTFDTKLTYSYKYKGRRIYTDETVSIKDLFEIKEKGSDDYVPGSSASSFIIKILDIKDANGNPVLSETDLGNTPDGNFEYNESTGQIRCSTKGTYYMSCELWDLNGHSQKITMTFLIVPHEITYR